MAISGAAGTNYLASSSSGLDTTSIINQLVSIESQPITALQTKQSNIKSQVSQLGQLSSLLSNFDTAVQALKTGVVQVGVSGSYTGFNAVADSTAAAGSYSVQVTGLAQASKSRSQGFSAGSSLVAGGNLHIDSGGSGYDITVADGTALSDLVNQINGSGAPVQAAVVSDGTQSYLQVTNRNTGFPSTITADQALNLAFTPAGTSANTALAFTSIQPAANAALKVDQLTVTSQSNDVTGVIPGVTLTAKALTSAPETLTLSNDEAATAKALQNFVTTYNALATFIEGQLNTASTSSRATTLAGDPSVRSLQQQLHALFSTSVPGLTGVSTLADLGITTQKDGSVSLDTSKLNEALSANPDAVNKVFSTASTGIAGLSSTLLKQYTDPISGAFTLEQQDLNNAVKDLDSQVLAAQEHATQYRTLLVQQFSAMETIVSAFKSTSQYLTNLTNQLNNGSK
jgi:flagellar hook-associated protein 2